jgi:SAM-dependent methyltransferase
MQFLLRKIIRKLTGVNHTPHNIFHSHEYLRHNQRRLEHLATLGLEISGSTVLEVGAGIGDHTSFFLDRGCQVLSTDARDENLKLLRSRYPNLSVKKLDMDDPDEDITGTFDIVYCYGLLYHLKNPAKAIEFMGRRCGKMLLLETVVSYGDAETINPCFEDKTDHSQSIRGSGCRPTRLWIYQQLKQIYPFIYMPLTQPNHEQFPLDWSTPPSQKILTRAIFIAAREKLANSLLVEDIPMQQIRS